MSGLNGESVLTIKDLFVGTVPGEEYGYKRNLRVTVDIRMERLTRQDEYETTEHKTVTGHLDFALTTGVWNLSRSNPDIVAGGATTEPLRHLVTFANGFDADKARELADLADRWHLNGMSAGCAHQTVVYAKDQYGRSVPSLDLTPPCPVTGYKYGHAWLLESLPDGFMDTLKDLLPEA
jgi:hypothetical protein